jgi:predicted negative regulator of RcsB-dependent stress response
MKAEKRKEIETNSLAKWLNNVWTGTKRRSAYAWVTAIVLALVLIFGWNYWSKSRTRSHAEQWVELDDADTKEKLEDLANKYRDSLVGKAAKLRLARLALGPDGLDQLGTLDGEQRKKAVVSIERARELYANVAPDLKDNSVLQQEAWLGAAEAEEALLAVPTEGSEQPRGNIEKVIEYLKKAREVAGDSDPGKAIEKKMATYEKDKEQITKFYADVRRQLTPPKIPELPPLGPLAEPKEPGKQPTDGKPPIPPLIETKEPAKEPADAKKEPAPAPKEPAKQPADAKQPEAAKKQ